ncbi:MAG: UvrB/UvrC motif-containing protein [Victivallaceae bacterium]|nr:UvrB/UvrC motif-containing protein [Victivallaceae bacterium]
MICEICKKNPATIHIQEIVDNQKKSMHICAECAEKKSAPQLLFDGNFNLAEVLYNITEHMGLPGFELGASSKKNEETETQEQAKATCMKCGWTLSQLRKTGRLGCSQCYKSFRDVLDDAFDTMHRGKLHVGKKPGGKIDESSTVMLEIMNMKKELEELVQREEYEKAAVVRDKINALTKGEKKVTNSKQHKGIRKSGKSKKK